MIIDKWKNQIRALGVNEGDTLLIRASLKALAPDMKGHDIAKSLITALLDAVGPSGTIIGLSFSQIYFLFRKDRALLYQTSSDSVSGGFANALLKWPGAHRSKHPTNSFVAVGPKAAYLLDEHGPNSSCFAPVRKLIDLDGKMILVGCIEDSPGFSTVHLIQHELGFSTKNILSNKMGMYYLDDNKQLQLYKRKDIPGCSKGFYKFYSHYEKAGKLREGYIGEALSYSINAIDAYKIEYDLVKNNPKIALCDNSDCIVCRGTWYYNMQDWPGFYLNRDRLKHLHAQLSSSKRLARKT